MSILGSLLLVKSAAFCAALDAGPCPAGSAEMPWVAIETAPIPVTQTVTAGEEQATIANPAAVFCEDSGGTYDIRDASDGGKTGVCVLPDGEEVDAWEYFRANSAPDAAGTGTDGQQMIANPAAVFCEDSGGAYDIRETTDGGKTGFCVLPDGEEVDAWEHFRANAASE